MSSEISVIGSATSAVPTALAAGPPIRFESRSTGGAATRTEKSNEVDDGRIAGRSQYALAQSGQDVRNQVAVATRGESERLGRVQEKLTEMKANVEAIVKQFPPYPADSSERIELLNQVAGLRKQIEALTIPAETKAGQSATPQVGLGDFSVLDKVPGDVISDAELEQLLSSVESSQTTVASAQKKLWADVQVFVSGAGDAQAAAARSNASGSALASVGLPIGQSKSLLANLL